MPTLILTDVHDMAATPIHELAVGQLENGDVYMKTFTTLAKNGDVYMKACEHR